MYAFATMEAEGEGWDPVWASLGLQVEHYWPFRGDAFVVVLFINCYVVFHFLLLFF